MKKLYIVALITGLSFGLKMLGHEPHEGLKNKIYVPREKVESDIKFLLEEGYREDLSWWPGKPTFWNDSGWRCYLRSPKGKCVMNINLLKELYTTQYEKPIKNKSTTSESQGKLWESESQGKLWEEVFK